VEATNLKDVDMFSKIDPYCIVIAGAEHHRTKAMKNAGTNPRFDISIEINIQPGLHEVVFEVYDSNKYLNDEFLGRGRFPMQDIQGKDRIDRWVSLNDADGKSSGEIHVILTSKYVRILHISSLCRPPILNLILDVL
jgi:Ca2+-dependent lipid-binding protein